MDAQEMYSEHPNDKSELAMLILLSIEAQHALDVILGRFQNRIHIVDTLCLIWSTSLKKFYRNKF